MPPPNSVIVCPRKAESMKALRRVLPTTRQLERSVRVRDTENRERNAMVLAFNPKTETSKQKNASPPQFE